MAREVSVSLAPLLPHAPPDLVQADEAAGSRYRDALRLPPAHWGSSQVCTGIETLMGGGMRSCATLGWW